ncbi:MAG: TRAP transporter small permease [Deltaproteobacteria bacterium HGW-Deltaproteobacteria-24]|nr:MAG: TRAP transporter small permease [Deltaproteobacteria bacterium HGW-Deltaproteobacteria-24]
MFSFLNKFVGFINQSIAVIGITAGVALSFVNVVARYVFDASLTWATELTIFLFVWSAFFGAAYCFKKDAHIAIDIVLTLVPSQLAKIMLLISHVVTLIFLSAISFFGYQYLELVIELEEMSIDLAIPMWIPYLVIPVAFFLAAYRVAEKIVHIIKTPHAEVLGESEVEMIIASMGVAGENKFKKSPEELETLVKETHKKTGGML